jgi:hypothetical protein
VGTLVEGAPDAIPDFTRLHRTGLSVPADSPLQVDHYATTTVYAVRLVPPKAADRFARQAAEGSDPAV